MSNSNQPNAASSFDLFRLNKAKSAVDLAPNTIRAYFKEGLPCYKRPGKKAAVFVSRNDLELFIKLGAEKFRMFKQAA